MIGKVLAFLRKQLDDYLRAELAGGVDDPIADKVVFLDGDKLDPISFKEESVTELLVNVEEERVLRAADPYARVGADGRPQRGQPDLRLILNLLFIARFKQYDSAWEHLSKVIEYLQTNRTFDRTGSPGLPDGVEGLTLELVTQSFAEQSDVWSMLKTAYHPSALYRVKLVVLSDARPAVQPQVAHPVVVGVRSIS